MPDTTTLRFAAPAYPGARQCLMCGTVTFGAVFPPAVAGNDWTWRQWISDSLGTPNGRAKSEAAAKNALLAAVRDFLRAASLEVKRDD